MPGSITSPNPGSSIIEKRYPNRAIKPIKRFKKIFLSRAFIFLLASQHRLKFTKLLKGNL